MKNIRTDIAKVIRKRRNEIGLSQEGLAEKAEIDRTYVSMLERGKVNITLKVAFKLASSLKIPLWKLIKEIEEL